jgi:hypothetical protein
MFAQGLLDPVYDYAMVISYENLGFLHDSPCFYIGHPATRHS